MSLQEVEEGQIRTQEKQMGICKPGRVTSPEANLTSALILDFQPPDLWEISFCFLKPPVCGDLLCAAAPEDKYKGDILLQEDGRGGSKHLLNSNLFYRWYAIYLPKPFGVWGK